MMLSFVVFASLFPFTTSDRVKTAVSVSAKIALREIFVYKRCQTLQTLTDVYKRKFKTKSFIFVAKFVNYGRE
jgi:hypothetical protein